MEPNLALEETKNRNIEILLFIGYFAPEITYKIYVRNVYRHSVGPTLYINKSNYDDHKILN